MIVRDKNPRRSNFCSVAKFERAQIESGKVLFLRGKESYAAMPNNLWMNCACALTSPLATHLTRPFR